ncbi:magnesium-translocating P-type ATPase [Methylococcus geothermalis]|uniref:Magnesium-transporting ATPase, P-type 1 n=1 Tax=Methylococcus geothermalis TaxID=2681310 RepID=A0A858QAU2_9GAMM|nr:magnesium-translocating P-type ATPase [Methylococcus geothermalis]QJD31027.1 magnesium-translocating P-type ATPase [Methylococcus geothermalis]
MRPKNLPHAGATTDFLSQPLSQLLSNGGVSQAGLTQAEAWRRLKAHGPNVLSHHARRTALVAFLSRFQNPLVLLLVAAGAVSAFVHEQASFVIICVMVLASVTLDFIQEHRADRAAERLRESIANTARVQRDGVTKAIPVAELVPADVVFLAAGDRVPADGRLLEARDFFVSQALLTGEPYPVEKAAVEGGTGLDPQTATGAVFMGSSVISGSARLLVCATGNRTYLGGIAETIQRRPPPTAFEHGTRQFGLLLVRITLLLVLFVLFVNTFFGRPWLDTFLFAVALAVGLTPELLPMVVSVTLSRGALRMAEKKVIVKRLAAIHDLGSMDVLCTDKTGTLTEAHIRLEKYVDAEGKDCRRVIELAYLNSYFETGLRSPLDEAILDHQEIDVSGWTKIDEVPFDFERRRVSVLVADGKRRLVVVKGAPEDILSLSIGYLADDTDGVQPLDAAAHARLARLFGALSDDGFRVLGIAFRDVDLTHGHAVVDDESELVFAGFAAFLDPPKATASETLAELAGGGVEVKIVTGDNERVTQHLCRELGVPVRGVLKGPELADMDDHALAAVVDKVNLFCRVTPQQKNRIILALKQRGRVVGFLGDGINDAPPLHTADVSLSVDGAVDVAKEAADMILLEHDLRVLHHGVMEGRRTFGNIMKYIMMGTSSNFGNMFSMAGASLWLPFLPMLPTQILLNNFLYDTSEVPIPLDRVDEEFMARPRHWDMNFIRNFMLTLGPVSSLFDFLTFYLMLDVFQASQALFQTGWFVESLATQVLVIFLIRTRRAPFRSPSHPALLATAVVVVGVAVVLPFTPLGPYFGFEPLPGAFFTVLMGIVVMYLTAVEVIKRWFFRRFET